MGGRKSGGFQVLCRWIGRAVVDSLAWASTTGVYDSLALICEQSLKKSVGTVGECIALRSRQTVAQPAIQAGVVGRSPARWWVVASPVLRKGHRKALCLPGVDRDAVGRLIAGGSPFGVAVTSVS